MEEYAIFTPWPSQHSGIADYAFDLAPGLTAQGVRVSVFTDAENPLPAGDAVRIAPTSSFPGPGSFDRVIYQMGNHCEFHGPMIAPLCRDGGIVHLHDMVLHHLVYDLTSGFGEGHLYYRLIKHWYGQSAFDSVCQWNLASDSHFTHSPLVTEIPLFEPLLHYADACIVHSEFTRQRVQAKFPSLPCQVVPQTYRNGQVVDRQRGDVLHIGTFGSINPTKHLDQLLWAIKAVVAQRAKLHLHVVGNLDADGDKLRGLADDLELHDCVTFHGRVGPDDFHQLMRKVDLCVALRFPTMGETSGVVSRAIQMGIPVIVNDIGWYAELPACVEKLPVDLEQMQQQLAESLAKHALDRAHHGAIRSAAAQYAHDVADFERVNKRYRAMVNAFPAPGTRRINLAKTAA